MADLNPLGSEKLQGDVKINVSLKLLVITSPHKCK